MSQNAKSKTLEVASPSSTEVLIFKSEIGLFLAYLFVRTAPLVAVVFYFSTLLYTIVAAMLLLLVLLWAARRHNHRFLCQPNGLYIQSSFWQWGTPYFYSYTTLQQAAVKVASRQDKRQWLSLQDATGCWKRFRCDWLHQQDPPSVEEHEDDTPQHELFELLDEEDFYRGSIQHLAYFLQQKGISVQLVDT